MSPQSTLSSNPYPAEIAPLRWFGLLADDADNLNPVEFNEQNLGQRSHATDESSFSSLRAASFSTQGFHSPSVSVGTPVSGFLPHLSSTPGPPPEAPVNQAERKYWQTAVTLREHEIPVFKHFVDNLSFWLDLYDPLKHFSSLVPQLAMNNEGLMKSILALSSRHLSIRPGNNGETMDRTAAVQYYSETLQYLQGAMRYESFNRSLELLATALIVSKYEMIDGAGSGWERHLKGVFWIQRSQDINGQSGGLKQAVWWSWLRQDVWAAFRERRRCFSFYKPTRPYQLMDQYDIASRAVYLLAQAVNYASEDERKMGEVNLHANRAAAAVQMHNFARILLLIHQPAAGGYREYLAREKSLNAAIDTVIGLAMTIDYEPAEVVSTQCLFAAGLYASEAFKRDKICELIERHQRGTGWPVQSLADELRGEWARTRPP
ncbi:putative zn 2cys6 transcription factor protein [Neofusicoccum parvum UCRNP2]|uniref:Putative zn 2cys6 transcription factor protein n=1 Tax=Botryosphaeria parva (strain UCR-NP2) TaxID=1287680 RepID=R1ELE9_BOTPV|nr:putative zn 2cys6 transcription factor protein [Neofusicoccum parvum UCRNP2]